MRILHIQAQLPAKTGSGVYFSNVIKGLQEHENACVYGGFEGVSLDLPIEYDLQFPLMFPNDECGFPLPGMSDVMPYKSTVYGEMTPVMIKQWQDVFLKKITEAVEKVQPDILFCHHLWFLTSLVKEHFPELPIFAFCHGTDLRQARQHPYLKAKYVNDLQNVTHVFALSQDQVPEIAETFHYPREKISVLGGGYDPNYFYCEEKKARGNRIELVYAGKLSAAKGVFELLEVFDQLVKSKPHVKLSLVGNANEEALAIIRMHQKHNLNLRLFNVKDQPSLARLFRQTDLFILPSYYEGLGLTAIEALASGMRVVTTEIEPLKEQLGEKVNRSGVIEYVPLPRLYNQDEPFPEDLPEFKTALLAALCQQIERLEQGEVIAPAIQKEIKRNAWPALIERLLSEIKKCDSATEDAASL